MPAPTTPDPTRPHLRRRTDGTLVVRRSIDDPDEHRRRARWLERHGGDGLETLLDASPGRLETRHEPAVALTAAVPGPDEAAPILAAVASVLCRLRDASTRHGGLGPDDVLILGSAEPGRSTDVVLRWPGSGTVEDDELALATIVAWLHRRWTRDGIDPGPHTAAWSSLADTDRPRPLHRALAMLERMDDAERTAAGGGVPIPIGGLAVGAAVAAIGLVGAIAGVRSGGDPAEAARHDPPASGPTVDLEGLRYRLGRPGDVVAPLPPWCGPAAVLLRPADGRVWLAEVERDPVALADVPGAATIGAIDCDGVELRGAAGSVRVGFSS